MRGAPAPHDASAIVTKLVSGVASKYPPVLGWSVFSIGEMRGHSAVRIHRNGFHQLGGA